jgi:hypothetical protein
MLCGQNAALLIVKHMVHIVTTVLRRITGVVGRIEYS